jgi:DNA invertase Pin-like site-specific DNA recombinase
MTKVILYARFSPRRNAEQCESIDMQFEMCRDYCRKQGYEIASEYSDHALSGSEEDRPGLWNAIEALKRGYLLIVYRLDRLARSVYLSYIIEQAVQKRNAKIVSISGEGTWQDGPEDELVRRILQALAEYERKVIAARTKAAMLRHQANGRRMSGEPPFGFAVDPDNPACLIENVTEQETIQRIVTLKQCGMPLRAICRQLQEEGAKCRNGGKWHHTTVKSIIRRCDIDL